MRPDYVKTAKGYAYEYPRAAMTADCVLFGFDGQNLLLSIRSIKNSTNVSKQKATSILIFD